MTSTGRPFECFLLTGHSPAPSIISRKSSLKSAPPRHSTFTSNSLHHFTKPQDRTPSSNRVSCRSGPFFRFCFALASCAQTLPCTFPIRRILMFVLMCFRMDVCVCVFVYFLVLIFYTLGSALTHLPRPLVAFACPKDLYLPERSTKKTLVGSAFVHTFPFFLSHYTGRQVAITKSVHWRSTGWIARKLLVHFSSPTRNFFALHFRSGASARARKKKEG